MTLNFPNTPPLDDRFLQWRWDGVKWTSTGIHLDAPEDGQLYGRENGQWQAIPSIPTLPDIGTPAQLRASVANKLIDTTGLQGALNIVVLAGISGTFTPDFHQYINVQLNLAGNTTFAFPASVADLQGRSGLIITYNGVAATVGWAVTSYSVHKGQALDYSTTAGHFNVYSYSIWNPGRIAIGLIAGGVG